MEEKKYVDVQTRVSIEYVDGPETGEPALKIVFVDKEFKPATFPGGLPLEPLYIFLKDKAGVGRPVKFKHVSFTAEFIEAGFARVKDTLNEIDPSTGDWAGLEKSKDEQGMNPSGPPKP